MTNFEKQLPLEIIEEIMIRIEDGRTLAYLRNICKSWKDLLDFKSFKLKERWVELCLKLPRKAFYDIMYKTYPKYLHAKNINYEQLYKSYYLWEKLSTDVKWECVYTHIKYNISTIAVSGPWCLIATTNGYLIAYNLKTHEERDLFFSHTVISNIQLTCYYSEESSCNLQNISHDEAIVGYGSVFATFNLHNLKSEEHFNGPHHRYICEGYTQAITKKASNGSYDVEFTFKGNEKVKNFDNFVEVISLDNASETICIKNENSILFYDKNFQLIKKHFNKSFPSGTIVFVTTELYISYSRSYIFVHSFKYNASHLHRTDSLAIRTITHCKIFAKKLIVSSPYDIRIYHLEVWDNAFTLPSLKPVTIKLSNHKEPIIGFDAQIESGKPVLYVWAANKINKISF